MSEYLDASVVVKWFKKREPYESEAMELYGKIRDLETDAVTSEWTALEVVRGLTKVGYPREKIETSYEIVMELSGTGAIRMIPVSGTIHIAKSFEIEYNLYAADAVHLAASIVSGSSILWSEDRHLSKEQVLAAALKYGVEIKRLREMF